MIDETDLQPWINTFLELPPYDGEYECTDNPDGTLVPGFDSLLAPPISVKMQYDGYGFKFNGIYRAVSHWRYCKPIEKRYGKLIKEWTL